MSIKEANLKQALDNSTANLEAIAIGIKGMETDDIIKIYVMFNDLVLTAPDNQEDIQTLLKEIAEKTNVKQPDGTELVKIMRHLHVITNICSAILFDRGVGVICLPTFLKDALTGDLKEAMTEDHVISVDSNGIATVEDGTRKPFKDFINEATVSGAPKKRVLH